MMQFTIDITLPKTPTERGRSEMTDAANRALAAFVAALAEPENSTHRVDLSNALNYIATVVKQERARPAPTPNVVPLTADEFMTRFSLSASSFEQRGN